MKYSFEKLRRKKKIEKLIKPLKDVQWKYKNCILLIISLVIAAFLLKTPLAHGLEKLGSISYVGILIGGMLYSFSLTIAPSIVILYSFSKSTNPIYIAFLGAFGTVLSDYFIFRFVRDNLIEEIKMLNDHINNRFYFKDSVFYRVFPFSNLLLSNRFKITVLKISQSKAYRTFIKILAGFIIASPLPDELGIALLGAAKQDSKEFVIYSYILNFLGILSITYFSKFY